MTPAGSANAPEALARVEIDRQLTAAGWTLLHRDEMNLIVSDAIAVREFTLAKGHGFVDYMFFLDGKAVGVCEAKPAGFSLTGVEFQAAKSVHGLPPMLDAPIRPLPFALLAHSSLSDILSARSGRFVSSWNWC